MHGHLNIKDTVSIGIIDGLLNNESEHVSNELVLALPELVLNHWHTSTLVHNKKSMSSKSVSWHGSEPKSSGIRKSSADCLTISVTVNKHKLLCKCVCFRVRALSVLQ